TNNPEFVLVDIRNKVEFEKGHLENAINIHTPDLLNETNTKVFKELKIKKFSEKLLLRELILHINYISNKMEDASDKLDIIALKLKT
ncbi:MAG: hypothetical protein DRP84_02775, partial [Spirochaetes bacterium]